MQRMAVTQPPSWFWTSFACGLSQYAHCLFMPCLLPENQPSAGAFSDIGQHTRPHYNIHTRQFYGHNALKSSWHLTLVGGPMTCSRALRSFIKICREQSGVCSFVFAFEAWKKLFWRPECLGRAIDKLRVNEKAEFRWPKFHDGEVSDDTFPVTPAAVVT